MNTAIVAAAGSGSRMKSDKNKQFLVIDGLEVLSRTLKKLSDSPLIDRIIIVARKSDFDEIKSIIKKHDIKKADTIAEGGETRRQSVFNALMLVDDEDIVLIHDGARPFISENLIEKLIRKAKEKGAAAPGLVLKDTISTVDENGFFKDITDRNTLRAIQTPQVFFAEKIKKAHQMAKDKKLEFTDDCSLYKYFGGEIAIIDGEQNNIKITVPEDILLAEFILKNK